MNTPPIDKIYHAAASYAAVRTFVHAMPLLHAFVLTLVAGAIKEWYDHKRPPHQAEWNDFWADGIGALAAVAVVFGLGLVT